MAVAAHSAPRGTRAPRRRAAQGSRFGDFVSACINVVLLALVNVAPGWEAVPFLTGETTRVLGLVNLSLALGVATGVLCAVVGSRRLRAWCGAVTAGVSAAVLVRVWQVFPFDFAAYTFNWTLVARVCVGVSIAGCLIGVIVQLVAALRPDSR